MGLGGSGEDGGRRAEWPELAWVCHARVLGSEAPCGSQPPLV